MNAQYQCHSERNPDEIRDGAEPACRQAGGRQGIPFSI